MSNRKKHLIAGTAGHIDHGKTTLVRTLTGVDTDRLKEEKERGITIDLGFASSELSNDITLSWIDVPGHERFIGNMLAGAAGIDFVILVVAANEGVMPQTREHFEICRLLDVRDGLVVLTKSDLGDADSLAFARAEVEVLVSGSFLEAAPILAASCRTGEGVAELRAAVEAVAARTGARQLSGNFRLPVDRAFSMKGFGTVVTGTVFNGRVERDAEVELLPGSRKVRIRGVHVHGELVDEAIRGQRAALNLAGIETADVQRGNTLATPESLSISTELDVNVEFIEDAPVLPNLSSVHLHLATQSTVAKIRFHDGVRDAKPGDRLFARLLMEDGIAAVSGDRFILRRFSPVVTIGGGTVLDVQPPRIRRKQLLGARLQSLRDGGPKGAILLYCSETPFGLPMQALSVRMGATTSEVRELAAEAGLLMLGPQADWVVLPEQMDAAARKIMEILAEFHNANPLLSGMPRERLRKALDSKFPDFLLDGLVREDPRFEAELEVVRLASHRPSMTGEEDAALHRIEKAFLDAGLQVPAPAEVLTSCGVERTKAATLLQKLTKEGRLIKVGQELIFHKHALGTVVSLVRQHKGQSFSVPEFKAWTGVSRKYAIPLLEFLDRQRITRRDGDRRVVL